MARSVLPSRCSLLLAFLAAMTVVVVVTTAMQRGPDDWRPERRPLERVRSELGLQGGLRSGMRGEEKSGGGGEVREAGGRLIQYPGVTEALQKAHLPLLESLAFDASAENNDVTFLSGAFNIGRKSHLSATGDGAYSFEGDYIRRLNWVLGWGQKMEVVVEPRYAHAVELRKKEAQRVREVSVEELQSSFLHYDAIQKIRSNPDWLSGASWLPSSPQANTALYNVVVMSKLYFLADLCERNPYSTTYFAWVDAGVCSETMVGPGNIERLKVRMQAYMRSGRFWICHAPYPSGPEVHGFSREELHKRAGQPVHFVPKGGYFGGTCDAIKKVLVAFDHAISETLRDGFMGTEETIFGLLHATHPHLFEPCVNSVAERPNQETLCQFLDDNYRGFGEDHQLSVRSSATALKNTRYS